MQCWQQFGGIGDGNFDKGKYGNLDGGESIRDGVSFCGDSSTGDVDENKDQYMTGNNNTNRSEAAALGDYNRHQIKTNGVDSQHHSREGEPIHGNENDQCSVEEDQNVDHYYSEDNDGEGHGDDDVGEDDSGIYDAIEWTIDQIWMII